MGEEGSVTNQEKLKEVAQHKVMAISLPSISMFPVN